MTLILTELSSAGIAMAADSAITKIAAGRIVEVDQQGWTKLLRVPSILAGISYWGMIGAISTRRFDTWLKNVIDTDGYTDLATFGDQLVDALNRACRYQPLAQGQDVGIHVAGYVTWTDGIRRPGIFHVHNGHGTTMIQHEVDEQGHLISVRPEWKSEPRTLFEKHQDFPIPSLSLEENLALLRDGIIIRNGSYFLYAVIWNQIQLATQYINLIPGVSLPRDPVKLGSRKGYLHILLEIMIKLYQCSNQRRIVGGTVTSLGIGPEGYIR